MTSTKRVLTATPLALISIAAIINLRSLPMMAKVGLNSLFFYTIAALFFLIPSALICAELATTFSKGSGGIYLWVKRAFGEKIGFLAIWSEWFNNVIAFPTTIIFIASAITYAFAPALIHNKHYMIIMMLVILWGTTFYNCLGLKASSRLNALGATFGTIIPSLIIIALAIIWIASKRPIQLNFTLGNLLPPMHGASIAFLIGVFSAYAGMQVTSFHAQNVVQPAKSFPKAIFLSVITIFALTVLVSLAIAIVVPTKQLNLISGMFEGFQIFLNTFHIGSLLPALVLLIALSSISELSAWLLAPARGVAAAAKDGLFPRWCSKETDSSAPYNVLILQAVVVTLISFLFILLPNFSTAFWLLMVLTSQFTMTMYILMFASAIRLRYSEPNAPRPYQVPGNKPGIWLISGLGIMAATAGLIFSFFPPAQLHIANITEFETIIIIGDLFYLIVPCLIYFFCKRRHSVNMATTLQLKDI